MDGRSHHTLTEAEVRAIISDEAAEAMLHPDLWGLVRFLDAGDKGGDPEAGPDL